MTVSRERQRFPTRNYPYGRASLAGERESAFAPFAANTLYRRVGGIDLQPRLMEAVDLAKLGDPFGQLLRSGAPFPLSLRALLHAVDNLPPGHALPRQLVFLVADGGHVSWSEESDALQRGFRIAVARGKGDFPLLVSASTLVDSEADEAFLQVIGWDLANEVFHYYERLDGTYFWAGMSLHALEKDTRLKGPFDSHVNGSLVMKELRAPWTHWHAPLAGINEDALAPDDPFRNESLFLSRVTADRLETEVVRPGIHRWNEARVRKALDADGRWRNIPYFLRQVVTDTTVNLASSDSASRLLRADRLLRPPLSFFLNRDTLFDTLGLEPNDDFADIAIPGRHYLDCVQRFDVHRLDNARFRVDGDTHFAFLTPEAAFEDTDLLDVMVREGLLSRRLAACLSMTDFTNPVFSPVRAALLGYVPDEVPGPGAAATFETQFVNAVRAAATLRGSPEAEFLSNWDTPDFEEAFRNRIATYLSAVSAAASDADAVEGWFRLMEFRRRLFRRRDLAEFKLTVARTNIPCEAPGLRMTPRGVVEELPQSGDLR